MVKSLVTNILPEQEAWYLQDPYDPNIYSLGIATYVIKRAESLLTDEAMLSLLDYPVETVTHALTFFPQSKLPRYNYVHTLVTRYNVIEFHRSRYLQKK